MQNKGRGQGDFLLGFGIFKLLLWSAYSVAVVSPPNTMASGGGGVWGPSANEGEYGGPVGGGVWGPELCKCGLVGAGGVWLKSMKGAGRPGWRF